MIIKTLVSETSLARSFVARWCQGNGVDCGAGGDAIRPEAIAIDRHLWEPGSADFGKSPIHLRGDAFNLHWFRDGVLDYVYSSHAIEDADDTCAVLREWLRVLKRGGYLVICAPDQQAYLKFSTEIDDTPNGAHKHANFGLHYLLDCCAKIGITPADIAHHEYHVIYSPYSFELVIRKP